MTWKEAPVTIGGELLTMAEAMTLRVAICCYAMDLDTQGLGDDEHGKAMVEGYQRCCRSIMRKMMAAREEAT